MPRLIQILNQIQNARGSGIGRVIYFGRRDGYKETLRPRWVIYWGENLEEIENQIKEYKKSHDCKVETVLTTKEFEKYSLLKKGYTREKELEKFRLRSKKNNFRIVDENEDN